jgi:hypothetical protein
MQSTDLAIVPLSASGAGTSPQSATLTSDPFLEPGDWYNIGHIAFNWNIPSYADGVDYAISNNANLQIPDVNQGMVSHATYDLSNFTDGVWYFFVSFASGNTWSLPIVKTLQLDRTPPHPFIITREDTDETDIQPIFQWVATDDASGIDHYEAKIGDGNWFDPSSLSSTSSSYVLPPQSPTSERTLTVRAFDRAGNFTDASIPFTVLTKPVLCRGGGLPCAVSLFFAQWGWLIVLISALLILVAYGALYRLLRWRRQTQHELRVFKDELQRDLKRLEEEKGGAKGNRVLEQEVSRVVRDVDEELKRLKKDE